MTHNTSQDPQGTQTQESASMPVRFIRGNASTEELSAVMAIVAVAGAGGGGEPGPAGRSSPGDSTATGSLWSSPARMVRVTHPHGPGGWRASVSPR